MKLRPAVSIAAALAAISAVAAGSASAFGPTAASPKHGYFYVSHSAIGNNSRCASPGFNSVQAAVDAAPVNGTVYLCGSETFKQQVFLNKSVTLTGDPDASIGSPAIGGFADASSIRFPSEFQSGNLLAPQAIVVVTGADTKATIKGIDINGPLPGNGRCANREYGVLVLEGYLHLTDSTVTDVKDENPSLNGCQFGVGVQVGSTHWLKPDGSPTDANSDPKFAADAEIDNTTVRGYAKNGITVDGIGSDGDIHDNTVIGFGPTPVVAQNGIQISRGATGEVDHNSVSANQYTGGADWSTGVLLFGCGAEIVGKVDVHNNTAANNDVGIDLENYDSTCNAPSTAPSSNRVYNNNVRNDVLTNAYQAGILDVGNQDQIKNNKILGKGYAAQPTDFTSTINLKQARNPHKP